MHFFLVFQSREDDVNRDGVLDRLKFQLDMPMTDTEEVLGVTLILIFDYRLHVSNTSSTRLCLSLTLSLAASRGCNYNWLLGSYCRSILQVCLDQVYITALSLYFFFFKFSFRTSLYLTFGWPLFLVPSDN